MTEDDERIGLVRLVQKEVDRTFASRGPMDYRLTNDSGYMTEFVRPEPDPIYRPMPGAEPREPGDIRPAPILGLQWLVHAPAVETTVLDERGFPAPMRCPDPRYWAVHKLWLTLREDRDPQKKLRDRQQAEVLVRLISDRLPQFPMDEQFRRTLPRELSGQLGGPPGNGAIQPAW